MALRTNLKLLIPKLKKKINKIRIRLIRESKDDVAVAILEEIAQGRSPVKGKQFPQYSKQYAKQKGYRKPVDMYKTGDLVNSLRVRNNKNTGLTISFQDKKAEYHDKGRGRLPVRRLLPRKGESFKKSIMNAIKRAFKRATK